jgi:3-oxoadipate enol-lactonase
LKVQKASLVGLSMGGRIAIDFTLAHPELVQSLVLAAPGLSGFPLPINEALKDAAEDRGPKGAVELWLRDPEMAPAMGNPAISAKVRRITMENANSWLVRPDLERVSYPPAIERLAEIHVPTLIVVGDRDGPDIQKIVTLLTAKIPDARREVILGSGHILNMEKPAEFDRIVLAFLTAHQ